MKGYPLLALLAIAPLVAAEKQDIRLADGRTLEAARIVSIGKAQVSIVHAGGLMSVSAESVPLDVLARAHMALEATAAERKKKEAETLMRVTQRAAVDKAKHNEEIQLRLALAAVRERGEPTVTGKPSADLDVKLLALKSKFPLKREGRISVRGDTITFTAPGEDVWFYYRSMVQTTTIQALPATLKRIDARIDADLAQFGKRGVSTDRPASAQARKSAEWIDGDLKPFLSQLRALLAP
jgi:hypothetical protein